MGSRTPRPPEDNMIRTILVVSLLVGSVWSVAPEVHCTRQLHTGNGIEYVEKIEEHCESKCEEECKIKCYDYYDVKCEKKVVQDCTREARDDECWEETKQTCVEKEEEKCREVITMEDQPYIETIWVTKKKKYCKYAWLYEPAPSNRKFWGILENTCITGEIEVPKNKTSFRKVEVKKKVCDETEVKTTPGTGNEQFCKPVSDITCTDIEYNECMKVKQTKCKEIKGKVEKKDCVTMHTRVPVQKQVTKEIVVCGEMEEEYVPLNKKS